MKLVVGTFSLLVLLALSGSIMALVGGRSGILAAKEISEAKKYGPVPSPACVKFSKRLALSLPTGASREFD